MKEITFPDPTIHENTIPFYEVQKNDYPLIGIATEDGRKVTLIPVDYTSNLYIARCVWSWEKGNGYNPGNKNEHTIQEWCEFFNNSHKAKIYVFDSVKELFTWLVK